MSDSSVQFWIMIATWFGAIAASIAAGIAAWFTLKQNRIVDKQNEILANQSRIQLFNERYEIYKAMVKFMAIFLQMFKMDREATNEFNILRDKAHFLFEKTANDYLKRIYKMAIDISSDNDKIGRIIQQSGGNPLPPEQEKEYGLLVQKHHDDTISFSAQFEESKKEFAKYLDLSKIQ